MAQDQWENARRRFLRAAVVGVIAAPVAGLLGGRNAAAQDQPRLELSDPQAKSLSYVHDATKTDHPAHKEGRDCANCLHWTGGDKQWGGCNIFPGKLVNRDGWCVAWAKRG